MTVLESARLRLRPLTADDAAFILELVNEPAWLQFIGDRNVHTLDDARTYIAKGPATMYARHGFGPLAVELKEGGAPVGICGLIKRETLPDVDLGYALLARFRGRGYASEAAAAVLAHGKPAFGLARVIALTAPDNTDSIRLLERLGFRYERMIAWSPYPESKLFAHESEARSG